MARGHAFGWKALQQLPKSIARKMGVPGFPGILITPTRSFEVYFSHDGRNRYVGTFRDLKAANDARDAYGKAITTGQPVLDPSAGKLTFDAFAEEFFKTIYLNRKPSTVRAARSRYRTYLAPAFAQRRLRDITDANTNAFSSTLLAMTCSPTIEPDATKIPKRKRYTPRRSTNLSNKTKREVLHLLRQILVAAKRAGHIPRIPMEDVEIPSAPRDTARIFEALPTYETAYQVVEAITAPAPKLVFQLVLWTGARIGEVLGLTWEDVDLERNHLRIRKSVDAVAREAHSPKTRKGVRVIPLVPELVSALKTYRALQHANTVPRLDPWLFPSTRAPKDAAAPVLDPRNLVQRYLHPAQDACQAGRFGPHALRHLFASRAVTVVDVARASAWLGHSSPAFTYATYVHPLKETEAEDAEKLGALMGRTDRNVDHQAGRAENPQKPRRPRAMTRGKTGGNGRVSADGASRGGAKCEGS